MKKIIPLAVLLLLIAGCARESRMANVLASMDTIDQARETFGQPASSSGLEGGETLYTWYRPVSNAQKQADRRQDLINRFGPPPGTASLMNHRTYEPFFRPQRPCFVRITGDDSGKIVRWSYEGDHCDWLIRR